MCFISKQGCKLFQNFSETFSSQAKFGGMFCIYTVVWVYNYQWLFKCNTVKWNVASFVLQVESNNSENFIRKLYSEFQSNIQCNQISLNPLDEHIGLCMEVSKHTFWVQVPWIKIRCMKALIKLLVPFIGFCHCVESWVKYLKLNPLINSEDT